jgi:hypothetical protein
MSTTHKGVLSCARNRSADWNYFFDGYGENTLVAKVIFSCRIANQKYIHSRLIKNLGRELVVGSKTGEFDSRILEFLKV